MRVAIITPYFKESRQTLLRCVESVRAQKISPQVDEVVHVLVSDGHPQDWIDEMGLRHIRLGCSHGDYGNTPRSIGALLSASEGFDAICFLDADNWFDPEHVESCVDVLYRAAEPVDYVVARRRMVRDDGSIMPVVAGDDVGFRHVDTSCYFLSWSAFQTLGIWAVMPKPLSVVGDRVYRLALHQAGLKFAAVDVPTVNYLCTWSSFFNAIGEVPPPYAKSDVDVTRVIRWWGGLDDRSKMVVQRLTGCTIDQIFAE